VSGGGGDVRGREGYRKGDEGRKGLRGGGGGDGGEDKKGRIRAVGC
jgi:hypothetical protein